MLLMIVVMNSFVFCMIYEVTVKNVDCKEFECNIGQLHNWEQ